MELTVNGEPRTVADGMAVAGLLVELGLDPARVVVERNRDIVSREAQGSAVLAEGDVVEIVQFVGGG